MKIIMYFLMFIALVSCNLSNEQFNLLNDKIDSLLVIYNTEKIKLLEKKVDSLHFERNNELSKIIPNVIKHNASLVECPVVLYEPFGLKIEIKHERPLINSDIFLCVPAAFTTPNISIDGLFIENGEIINNTINEELNGACVFYVTDVEIIRSELINQKLIDKVHDLGGSIFQQALLIQNSEIIECNLWQNRRSLRRALVELGDGIYIVESLEPVTIAKFQEYLLSLNISNAIYLDMGTWSEGWVRNSNRNRITIGENMRNTNRQTNWLIYTNN